MSRWIAISVMLLGLVMVAQQTQPSFEVASIRLLPRSDGLPQGFASNPRKTADRLTWTTTLYRLFKYAYKLPDWRVSGIKEDWVYLSIDARLKTTATPDDVRAMLRQLLIERFKLASHTKVEERPGYVLGVGKTGPKLQVPAADGTLPAMPDYFSLQPLEAFAGAIVTSGEGIGIHAITGRGVPVSELAESLSLELGTFVLDKTGLNGAFYFGFTFQRLDYVNTDAPNAPTVFDAVERELGLKLERQRGPAELVVVDHIQNVPTEN